MFESVVRNLCLNHGLIVPIFVISTYYAWGAEGFNWRMEWIYDEKTGKLILEFGPGIDITIEPVEPILDPVDLPKVPMKKEYVIEPM